MNRTGARRSLPLPPSLRRPLRLGALALALALLSAAPQPAAAGTDDFEYGQRLAERGYYDLARKVYEAVLADANTTEEDKDAARYGLALLTKSQAEGATTSPAPYPEIRALFEKAGTEIAEFVQRNPKHPRAEEAKLAVGYVRLAFVTWCEQLLSDAGELTEHAGSLDTVRADAQKAVDDALEYFGKMRPKEGDLEPSRLAQLARYNWVVCQYYKALVQPPCGPDAINAFQQAAVVLEDYVTDNDGFLVAVYAQDILGLVNWKLAACEQDDKKKEDYYQKAVTWFDTCIETENLGDEYLVVITNGYYHMGQMTLEAGKSVRRFWREGVDRISKMLAKHPTAWRKDNGLRALVEWSKIECARGDAQKAVEIAKDAANRAKMDRKPQMERVAGRALNDFVSGSCGGGAASGPLTTDPTVLLRVADDLFLQERYPDAIRAYRAVIGSLPDTPKAFVDIGIPTWRKMAGAYRKMGDLLGAALALGPVHDAWMDGRIPHKAGDATDPNLRLAGDIRREAMAMLNDLAKVTQAEAFRRQANAWRDAFVTEYAGHISETDISWRVGRQLFEEGLQARARKEPVAAQKFAEARTHLKTVANNPNSEKQDLAWVYLIWADVAEGKFQDALTVAKGAEGWWASAEAKAQEDKFPDVRARRAEAKPRLLFYKGEALKGLARWEDLLAALKDFPTAKGDAQNLPQRALALQVEALLELKRMGEADALWQRLLGLDSTWDGLANVAKRFAAYYAAQYKDIEAEYRKVEQELRGKDGINRRLLAAEKRANAAANAAVDKINRKATLERLIALYEKDPKNSGVTIVQYNEAKKELAQLDKAIPADRDIVSKSQAEHDALQAQKQQKEARRDDLRKSLLGPLTSAARYYKQWDDALKAAGQEREPDNLRTFAYMFYYATTLDETAAENWSSARGLYEDYLNHPKVKALAASDPAKRGAVAKLGEIYVHFAEAEEDVEKRRGLAARAVDFLQNSIANRPENNGLVVGLLTGDYVTLPWPDPVLQRTVRVPVKAVKDVPSFQKAVQDLGKPEGAPLPRFEKERDQTDYAAAVGRFQAAVAKMSAAELQRTVASFENAGLDWYFYREHADASVDYRVALAWAYSQSGRPEDLPKALMLSDSLVAGPLTAEEESLEWWTAYTIRLRGYLAAAEAAAPGAAGAPSGTQSQWLDKAKTLIRSVSGTYPDLGDANRPKTRAQWHALLQRLNGMLLRANMTPLALDLSRRPPPAGGGR